MDMARNYSVYEAKAKLSELLRIVKRGHQVVVMERGKPIARVIPFEKGESVRKKLIALEESGLLIRGNRKPFPPGHKVKDGLKRFLKDR